jgi:hypothetical protein
VADDHYTSAGENAFQRFHRFGFLSTIHCGLLSQRPANPGAVEARADQSAGG